MRTNVKKVLERDQKLSELDDRANALQQGGFHFEVDATNLRKKYQRQNMMMNLMLGGVGAITLIVIIGKSFV